MAEAFPATVKSMPTRQPITPHAGHLSRRHFLAGTGLALGLHPWQPLLAAENRDPDVVVLGGVPCGIAAAVAAARQAQRSCFWNRRDTWAGSTPAG